MSRLSAELLITAGVEGLPHLDRLIERIEAAGGETGQLKDAAEALRREWDGLTTEQQAVRLRDLADAANQGAKDVGLLGQRVRAAAEDLDAISQAKITLGIADDERVKRQIEEVTAAYKLLQEEGGLSQAELARAAELHREKVEKLEAELGKVKPTLEDMAVGWGKVVAASAGLATVVKDAVEFEQAMAGVKKVVDGTDAQMAALSEQVKDMAYEMGLVPEAVAAIAAQGGQLGVAFADLPEFTRLAGQMSVAFGMTAEESANAAAKIANVFGISLAEVRALGDAINVLGNNTAAKESEITEAMLRIGGTAKQFGLAAEQAAALADAFIALGKSPEVAGTAINALLTKMQTAPAQGKEFQQALEGLGITAEELAANIRANPEAAIIDFMARLEQMDKQARAITLTELFGQEYADDISLAAGSLDTLRKAFGLVADKTQTAGAMQREFEAAMATAGAKIEQAKVAIGNLSKTLGAQLLPLVGTVAEGIGNAAQAISDFAEKYPLITQAATYLAAVKVAAIGVEGAMDAMGISSESAVTAATEAFGRFREAISSGAGVVNGLAVALRGLVFSPLGLTAGITAAVALYEALASSVDEVRAAQTQAMRTWADAEIAQTRLNMALAAGADVQGEYVQSQQALLNKELAAIRERIAGYEAQKQAAEERRFVDQKSVDAANAAIAAERERQASLQATVDATHTLIATARAEAQAQEQAARSKELSAQGWEQLTTQITAADKALLQIPPRSQQVIEGLRAIAQSGAESSETLSLAFRTAIPQVETAQALEVVKSQLTELAEAGKISQDSFAALSAAISARFAELPATLSEGAIALKQLGLDAQQVQTGIGKAAQDTLEQFAAASKAFGKDADSMARIFAAAARKMSSPEEFAALHQALTQAGIKAGLTAQDIKKIGDAAPQAANAVVAAFAKIGVDVDEVFTGISSKTRKAMSDYTYAVEQAMASGQDATKAARAGFEALAETLESPQAWAAYKQHLLDTGVGLDHLTQNQLKRMEDAIRGLPDVAATAMQAMKARIDSADVGSFARIRAEAQSAFAAGELSAAQYADVLRDLHDKTEQLRSKTQETGTSAAQAHDKAAEAAKRETEAKKENNEEQKKGLTYAESATNLINSAIGSYYQSIEALELHTTQLHQLRDAFNGMMMASRASTIDEALQNIKGIGDAVVAGGQRIMAMEQHIDQLTETLTSGAYSAQDLSRAMGALHTTTVDVKGAYISLDDTKLANLNAAIDAARQKLADMKQEAEDTRASLEAQLASLKGDDSKARALEEEKRLRELNLKLQDAEAKGQREIAAEYRQAIALQKQVFDEERRQTQQRKAEEAKRKEEATKRQSNSTSSNSSASGSSGKGISAAEVADAWDARIADAEKRGAENFARELYNQAKRQAR